MYVSKVIPLVLPTAKEDNDVSRAARLRRAKEALYVSGSSWSILMLIRVLFILCVPFFFLPLILLFFLSGIVIPQRVTRSPVASSA